MTHSTTILFNFNVLQLIYPTIKGILIILIGSGLFIKFLTLQAFAWGTIYVHCYWVQLHKYDLISGACCELLKNGKKHIFDHRVRMTKKNV